MWKEVISKLHHLTMNCKCIKHSKPQQHKEMSAVDGKQVSTLCYGNAPHDTKSKFQSIKKCLQPPGPNSIFHICATSS